MDYAIEINCMLIFCLQIILYYQEVIMTQREDPTVYHHNNKTNNGLHQTNEERLQRIKKSKNIRKEKVLQKRLKNLQMEQNMNQNQLTKVQKKQLQKQKNRMAAQMSRDRQKKYLQDLQQKIDSMQKKLKSQLCQKCKASLSDHSTSQGSPYHEQSPTQFSLNSNSNPSSPKNSQANSNQNSLKEAQNLSEMGLQMEMENQKQEIQELPFIRVESRTDFQWGNIGRYFCIFLVVIAVGLLSTSIQSGHVGGTQVGKFAPRILFSEPVCQKKFQPSPSAHLNPPTTQSQLKLQTWPFKSQPQTATQECKNNFWQQYLQKARTQLAEPHSNNLNLVSCSNPNFIQISPVLDENAIPHGHNPSGIQMKPRQDVWTFLVSNPTISHTHIQKGGNHYIDQVSYLDGVYQMTAERVVLKKVMGKGCIV